MKKTKKKPEYSLSERSFSLRTPSSIYIYRIELENEEINKKREQIKLFSNGQ